MLKYYPKYLAYLALIIMVQFVIIFALNWIIDPYKISDFIKVYKFNQAKPEVIKQSRLFKAVGVIHKTPKIVFIGSSRTDLGLNPDYLKERATRAYNLGVLGANMYEVRRYLEHAIANQPEIEQAILGIDFFMFNQTRSNKPDFREDRLEKTYIILPDLFNTTFSLNAIAASFATVESNHKKPKYDPYQENGVRNNHYFVKNELPLGSIVKGFEASVKKFLADPELYGNYQLSQKQLQNLQKIVELCHQNNIDLKIFISPAHAVQWETIRIAGLWDIFEQWKQEVVKITPIWDFSGYNSITTESVSETMKKYLDSSHYSQGTGNLVLNRILNTELEKTPQDFGVWLTSKNIGIHLEGIRRDRETWTKTNPNLLEFVNSLKR